MNNFQCCQLTGRKSYVLSWVFSVFPASFPQNGHSLHGGCLSSLPQPSQQGTKRRGPDFYRVSLKQCPLYHNQLFSCFLFLTAVPRKSRVGAGLLAEEEELKPSPGSEGWQQSNTCAQRWQPTLDEGGYPTHTPIKMTPS